MTDITLLIHTVQVKLVVKRWLLHFENTYGLPIVITHTMNVFGERQHPEKIHSNVYKKRCVMEKTVTVHSNAEKNKGW